MEKNIYLMTNSPFYTCFEAPDVISALSEIQLTK